MQVEFWIDDPAMNGAPVRTERIKPYQLDYPTDTTLLSNGTHSVTAKVTLNYGVAEVVTRNFIVQN